MGRLRTGPRRAAVSAVAAAAVVVIVAVAVTIVGAATGCGHEGQRWRGPPPGESQRPYGILPEYLVEPPGSWSPRGVDRESPRVPVTGRSRDDRAAPSAPTPER